MCMAHDFSLYSVTCNYDRLPVCDTLHTMDTTERRARAVRRRETTLLNRTTLKRVESDLTPLSGLAAIALVERLTQESWAAARKPTPTYRREEIPVRFVSGRLT
jgi:hypothetical protein